MMTDDQISSIAAQIGCACSIVDHRRFSAREFTGMRIELAVDGALPPDIENAELMLPGYLVADARRLSPSRLDLLLLDDPLPAFDPGAWLEAFEAVGGWYVITDNANVNVGWRVFGSDDAAQIKARALYTEIAHNPERQRRVQDFILESSRGLQPVSD